MGRITPHTFGASMHNHISLTTIEKLLFIYDAEIGRKQISETKHFFIRLNIKFMIEKVLCSIASIKNWRHSVNCDSNSISEYLQCQCLLEVC